MLLNFVRAKNELADLKRLLLSNMESVHQACLAEEIDWQFIPPRSLHFGGFWEAAVKTAKHHFYRSVGRQMLSFDELRTLVFQIAPIILATCYQFQRTQMISMFSHLPTYFLVALLLLSLSPI